MSLEVAMAILKPPALDPSVEGPVAADEGVPGRGEGVQASVEEAPAPRPARPGAIPDRLMREVPFGSHCELMTLKMRNLR
eukprot:g32820.t1